MSVRAREFTAEVQGREVVSEHLVRLHLGGAGLVDFTSSGVPDEWLGLVVPGQFKHRYYTVRSWADGALVLDVVVHEEGLVTEWAARPDCLGDTVTLTEPRGSFAPPADAQWLILVGDLTAAPAMARIGSWVEESGGHLDVRAWVESPDPLDGYFTGGLAGRVRESRPPAAGDSALADLVAGLTWPEGPGYFWMAGESAQMRAIRKHLMREVRLPSEQYDVMGYWRGGGQRRRPRQVDPGPIYAAGKAAGKSDEEIWADYDAARAAEESR